MDDATPVWSASTCHCGEVEIDATQRRVLVNGVPTKVGGRALDVLLALVERRDRVVPKRELMEVVWPRLVVEENNLLVHIVALRKLLGPQAIVTIPGRGYRLAVPVVARVRPIAAAASLGPTPGNLPAPPALVGREQDLDAIAVLLRDHAVVSIVGAGGIGKTSLALAATARIDVPGGRWWIELAPINDCTQVPNAIADVLGISLSPQREAPEALAQALASRNLLLVLDSCEHIAEDVAGLIDLLRERAPNVRLVVTSQESLKCRDEQVYRLGTLEVPASAQFEEAAQCGAVALFVERAHAVDSRVRLSEDNVEMVVNICRRLDGIPLAIEFAAARVPLLGVQGLHARLNQMFNVLTGGERMKLRRHQTLRAALEWSHSLLSADEKTLFRRLGVFAGGFTLELAQRGLSDDSIDQWAVLDHLGHLIDKSLVIAVGADAPRYRLLETSRAYALEQLGASGESDAMLRRHAQVMLQLIREADTHYWDLSAVGRSGVASELENLRAALDWALASEEDCALAYELLGKSWPVWTLRGVTSEGARRMNRLWPPAAALPAGAEAAFCVGYARMNKNAAGEDHWQAARRAELLYRQIGDDEGLFRALTLVAVIGSLSDRMTEAEQALCEVERLVDAATSPIKQAVLSATWGEFHLRRGEPGRAIAAFRRQVELARLEGAAICQSTAYGSLGCAQLDTGDLDGAIESLRRSVDGLRRFNAPYALELRLGTLAVALAWRGETNEALPLAREAFDSLRLLDVTFAPLMAAALQHARSGDARRAVLITGHACGRLPLQKRARAIALPLKEWVCERAAAEHPEADVAEWLVAGSGLSEERAAAIAFDLAPLD